MLLSNTTNNINKRQCCLFSLMLISLLVTSIALVLLIHVAPYTNLSEVQVWAQEDRWVGEQVRACQRAGGMWQADFSTAGCNVSYPSPDDSWDITPIENPWYAWCPLVQGCLVVFSCGLGIALPHCLFLRTERR